MNQRKFALFTGISLVMAFTALFSYGFVHGNLVVQGDADATLHNIQTSSSLFRAEIFGWIIIFITDIIASWALYFFLKPIHTSLSLLVCPSSSYVYSYTWDCYIQFNILYYFFQKVQLLIQKHIQCYF